MVRWGLLAASAAVLVPFLSMISIVFGLFGTSFLLSIILLIGLMAFLALTISGIVNGRAWGWSFLTFISLVLILYSFVIFLIRGMISNLAMLIASSVILLAISVLNFRLADEPVKGISAPISSSPKVEVYETLDKIEPEPVQQKSVQSSPAAKAVAIKSKLPFVASKMASTYHRSNCDWANNIKRRNRVWFTTEKQARKAGFKAHDCLAE